MTIPLEQAIEAWESQKNKVIPSLQQAQREALDYALALIRMRAGEVLGLRVVEMKDVEEIFAGEFPLSKIESISAISAKEVTQTFIMNETNTGYRAATKAEEELLEEMKRPEPLEGGE